MIFKRKKVEFIAARCPKCGGILELDSNLEIAICQDCKTRCLIDDKIGKREKMKTADKIIGFVEKQQVMYKENKQKKQEQKRLEEKEASEWRKKHWWVFLIIGIVIVVFVIIISILEKQNVI